MEKENKILITVLSGTLLMPPDIEIKDSDGKVTSQLRKGESIELDAKFKERFSGAEKAKIVEIKELAEKAILGIPMDTKPAPKPASIEKNDASKKKRPYHHSQNWHKKK